MDQRQIMGCVYEAPTAAPGRQFVLSRGVLPMLDWEPTACPLYLATLPGVAEAEECVPHWERGTLGAWLSVSSDDIPRSLLVTLPAIVDGRSIYAADPNRPKRGA